MAGPGGGPPRKSHTKSRNGCRTCKRRHIRCDESFPQCRNCTKHNCRCDYMDTATTHGNASCGSPPDLLTTPRIDIEIENWYISGVPPLPELLQFPRSGWHGMSKIHLRLIHHIVRLSIDLSRRGLSNCTAWAPRIPRLLSIAISSDFVMNSLMAFSAAHLAWITGNKDTNRLAYYHQETAMQGLRAALSAPSEDNYESILAASLLLSWLANDWRTWTSLQHGLVTMLNSMHPVWKRESDLARFIEGDRAISCSNVTGFQFHGEGLVNLDHILPALQNVQRRVGGSQKHYVKLGELIEFVRRLHKVLPSKVPDQAFEYLQPLRQWLLWLPPAILCDGRVDFDALAVIAQFYSVGSAVDTLLPGISDAYLGPLCIGPIEEIIQIIEANVIASPYNPAAEATLFLIQFPRHIVDKHRGRLRGYSQVSTDHYSSRSSSPSNGQEYRSFSSPSLPFATYDPSTSSIQPSPTVLTANSSAVTAGACITMPASQAIYSLSPQILPRTREMTAFGQVDINNSSEYGPAYMEPISCNMSRTEGVDPGLYGDHLLHVGGPTVAEACGT